MRMVIEVPDEFKALSTAVEALVTLVVAEGRRGAGGKAIDYGRVEQRVAAATAEVERAAHAGLLGGLDVDEPRVRIDRQTYTRVGRHAQTYYTLAGPVPVLRSVYRADGVRNGKVVDAVSLRAGVVADGWLPQTARAMAHEVQRGTAREAAASAAEVGRLPYSRSSFDRVTQAVGELYGARNDEIEDALITAYEPPDEARSVSVGLDRVAVAMAEPRPRPPGRRRRGAPKNPITVAWRMAWVATVTLHDKAGSALPALLAGDAQARLAHWRMRLLNVEHAAIDILGELRAADRAHVQVGDGRPVHEAITYLAHHHSRMNYAAARAAGPPIGSGNVEATCKTLVQVRMKRAGSRWKEPTGRHVLQLRALAVSDRWADAMVRLISMRATPGAGLADLEGRIAGEEGAGPVEERAGLAEDVRARRGVPSGR
ncbi:MAG: hypothetical protein IPL61_32255 [Myxococcales bacterium]|nr:hypothetical protein [Myxococcales bacterium]